MIKFMLFSHKGDDLILLNDLMIKLLWGHAHCPQTAGHYTQHIVSIFWVMRQGVMHLFLVGGTRGGPGASVEIKRVQWWKITIPFMYI